MNNSLKHWNHLETLLSIIAFLAVLLFLAWRVHFGIDFTDEALYYAAPYRFVLGDKPFHDDHFVYQFSSLLLYFPVKFYTSFFGCTDGLVLAFRFIYLIFTGLIGLFLILYFKRESPLIISTFLGLLYWIFIPGNIYSLGYNALAIGFLTLALFGNHFIAIPPKNEHRVWAYFIGFLHGLSVFGYPSLIVTFIPIALFLIKNNGFKSLILYGLGALTVPTSFFLVFKTDWTDLINTIHATAEGASQSDHSWTISQFVWIFKIGRDLIHFKWIQFLWLIGFSLSVRHKKQIPTLVLGSFFPLLMYLSNRSIIRGAGVRGYLIEFALFGFFFYKLSSPNKTDRMQFFTVFLPSLLAGMVFAWSSNNGPAQAALGFIPAVLLSHLWLFRILKAKDRALSNLCFGLITFGLTLAILIRGDLDVFMDGPISTLGTKVDKGIYRGLYTSKEKNNYWTGLYQALDEERGQPSGTIIFYPHFPAGYLMTHRRPAVTNLWGTTPEEVSNLLGSLTLENKRTATLVVIKSLYGKPDRIDLSTTIEIHDSIEGLKKAGAKELNFPNFDIYRIPNSK